MTPKEKAQELLYKYYVLAESIQWSDEDTQKKAERYNDDLGQDVEFYWHELAKKSALLAVDEIINELSDSIYVDSNYLYWQQVKQEIQKL